MNKREQIEESRISRALLAPFTVLTIQYFILVSFNLSTSTGSGVQYLSKSIVALFFFIAFPSVYKRNRRRIFVIYWFTALLFISHYIVFPSNRTFLLAISFDLFFMNIPVLLYSLALNDFILFGSALKRTADIVMFFGTLTAVFSLFGRTSIGIYSMSLSYYMLLPAIVNLDRLIDKFRVKTLIYFVTSSSVILSLGSRGALLCIAVFLVLKIIKTDTKSTIQKSLGYIGFLTTLVITVVFSNEIIIHIYNIFVRLGINSRTLRMLLQGNLHVSQSRDRIYQIVWEQVVKKPVLGIGLAGDRAVLEGIAVYVHNIFLEIIANFGIIVGSIIILAIAGLLIRSFFIRDRKKYGLISILVSTGFVHLFLSNSYLIDIKFWLFLGVTLNLNFNTGISQNTHESVNLTH
ncbi:MAG: hypothetical protein GX957_12535 [Clostridiaceae bacterium]|nr:hypothetical protein [Clostridiaceae bacterium]